MSIFFSKVVKVYKRGNTVTIIRSKSRTGELKANNEQPD